MSAQKLMDLPTFIEWICKLRWNIEVIRHCPFHCQISLKSAIRNPKLKGFGINFWISNVYTDEGDLEILKNIKNFY
jgi:hypothetical protein